jgi:hypothetical protein
MKKLNCSFQRMLMAKNQRSQDDFIVLSLHTRYGKQTIAANNGRAEEIFEERPAL